jgi:hypothetical protein
MGGRPADLVQWPTSSPSFRRQAENATASWRQRQQQRHRPRQRAVLLCVGRCFGARGRSALLICLVLTSSALSDSCLKSSPNASLSWCRAPMSLCLFPMLMGCRTMPFVLVLLLNQLPFFNLKLTHRTTPGAPPRPPISAYRTCSQQIPS